MDWYRIKHTIRMYMILTATKRATYLKKHDIFYHMGNNCMTMFRKIPLYPKLISFGNNVWIASNVSFITHDAIHQMLNNRINKKCFSEHIGCIELKDNVFIGANTTILSNVSIGPNVIVGAGSLVNKNLQNGVFAGVPAKYICSIEEFEKKRKNNSAKIIFKNGLLSNKTVELCRENFNKMTK